MSDWDRERAWQLCMELEQCMREAGVVTTAHYGRGQDVLAQALADARREAEAERDAARAELERVRGERDALIAAWPQGTGPECVVAVRDGWAVSREWGRNEVFVTRDLAVRRAAGLAPCAPAELTLAERNAVVAGVAGAMAEGAKEGGDG